MKRLLFILALLLSGASAQAATYYDQFGFHARGTCADPRNLWFFQSAAWFKADLGHDAQGHRVYADITLQMFPGGKYWMDYSEIAIIRYLPDGSTEGVMVFRKQLEGNWGVYGPQLALSNLFTAMPMTIHDHGGVANGFSATFFNAIHNPHLKDHPVTFGTVYSKYGPKGTDVHGYCHH